MTKPVRVRVIKAFGRDWHMHRVGEILVMDGGIRDIHLRRGNVELVEDEIETAAFTTKKRRRRRKTRAKAC